MLAAVQRHKSARALDNQDLRIDLAEHTHGVEVSEDQRGVGEAQPIASHREGLAKQAHRYDVCH